VLSRSKGDWIRVKIAERTVVILDCCYRYTDLTRKWQSGRGPMIFNVIDCIHSHAHAYRICCTSYPLFRSSCNMLHCNSRVCVTDDDTGRQMRCMRNTSTHRGLQCYFHTQLQYPRSPPLSLLHHFQHNRMIFFPSFNQFPLFANLRI
jgi:hypothetical protein